MERIKNTFSQFTLNKKINCLIIGVILIPLIIMSYLLFQKLKENLLDSEINKLEKSVTQDMAQLQKAIDACSLTSQIVLNNYGFWEKITQFEKNEVPEPIEMFEFRRNYVTSLEKVVNTNPYLEQIHIYVESSKIPEMMPILYSKQRMEKMSWAALKRNNANQWFLNYSDNLYSKNTFGLEFQEDLAGFVVDMNLRDFGEVTVEIQTQMNILFPAVYESDEMTTTFFVDNDQNFFSSGTIQESDLAEIWSKIQETKENEEINNVLDFKGRNLVGGFVPVERLNGNLVKLMFFDEELRKINNSRNLFLIILIVSTAVLCFIADRLVKLILKQFEAVMDLVTKVEAGDLSARVMCSSGGEFGVLANQMNRMLSQITVLMQDNINREVLVKNSEIKALQNQINAHFIYNVLESIKMMAIIDEKYEIANSITALGKLLRYSMKWTCKNVCVEEEVDYIKNYLALINLRFDYEIYLSINMPKEMWSQEIPKMSLQPIIENAICHGIEELAEDTSIYMKGTIIEDICEIEISDSGKGMSEEQIENIRKKINGEIDTAGTSGNGIGLKNVQDRIKISFGEEFGLRIMSKEGCYTKVVVSIPRIRRSCDGKSVDCRR